MHSWPAAHGSRVALPDHARPARARPARARGIVRHLDSAACSRHFADPQALVKLSTRIKPERRQDGPATRAPALDAVSRDGRKATSGLPRFSRSRAPTGGWSGTAPLRNREVVARPPLTGRTGQSNRPALRPTDSRSCDDSRTLVGSTPGSRAHTQGSVLAARTRPNRAGSTTAPHTSDT